MIIMRGKNFGRIVVCDFEYEAPVGDLPNVTAAHSARKSRARRSTVHSDRAPIRLRRGKELLIALRHALVLKDFAPVRVTKNLAARP